MAEKVTAASAIIAIHEAAEKIKCWDKFAGDALTLGINPMLPGEPGYQSPIEIITGQIKMKQEGEIMKAVLEQGITVDKGELPRALQYDRGQYEKGYRDGKADATPKWIPVTERLPNICEPVLACFDFMGGKAVKASDRYGKNGLLWAGIPVGGKVTHWMPLPEPPKGE